MKIVFAGTPDFAAKALEKLIEAGHEIACVLTQPDRPSGRGMKLTASPVKSLALENNIPVLTPVTLSFKKAPEESERILAELEATGADVFVVAAYGLILPVRFLEFARGVGVDGDIRAINIHASLLPRWRGAAPIARAIESGDATTGVTLMKMEAGLDTGPMIVKAERPILPGHTHATLTDEMAELGADLLVEALSHPDTLTWEAQPEEGVTYAEKLLKTEGPIDWNRPAAAVTRRIMAFNPFPGSTFEKDGLTMKVWLAHAVEGEGRPGEVIRVTRDELVVACAEGAVSLTELQRPGKRRMDVASFLQSTRFEEGEDL